MKTGTIIVALAFFAALGVMVAVAGCSDAPGIGERDDQGRNTEQSDGGTQGGPVTESAAARPPCEGGQCDPRDVSTLSLFSSPLGGQSAAVVEIEAAATVEEVLEEGLALAGASPVHLAFRGTAQEGSTRCEWRGVARTPGQREAAIRFWLHLDDDDELPSAAEVERRFLEKLDGSNPIYPGTLRANFLALARGGLSTQYLFLTCYLDYTVHEYLLGDGPSTFTISYDRRGEVRSYQLYREAHAAGEFGSQALLTRGEYEAYLSQRASDTEILLNLIFEGREGVLFLAPMGAHDAIAVEAWQAVAQWDLQTNEDEVVHAVRLGALEGDPEHTQTLTNLESRIETAAEEDEFADERMENADELDDHYDEIGAYDDITPDDGETTTFTPEQPPAMPTCTNGTAITDPGVNRGLVHDCEALLAAKDTLAGTATLDWASDTAITGWEGVTTSGTPSRVTELDLSSESLDGTIPAEIGTLFELTVLDLSSNSLTGDIPAELGWLFNLEEIGLSGNQLTGCIPVALEEVATNDLSSLNLLYCRPPSPENLTIGTPEEFRIGLSWDAVSNTANYRVEYRLGRTGSWTTDDDTLTTTTHTVDDLTCGSTYQFRMSAYGSGTTYAADWSEPSAVLSGATNECTPPEFDASSYSFSVAEDAAVGTVVGDVTATIDSADNEVSYSITEGNDDDAFAIGAGTGEITVAGVLDHQTSPSYTLTVEAEEGYGSASTATVGITVIPPCTNGIAVPNPSANSGLAADCKTLLGLVVELAGTATLDWSEDTAITSWEGVVVSGSPQRVVGLALPSKSLTGSLPSELGSLSSLSQLDLSNNLLTGAMPSELGSLSDLSQLDLSNNLLTDAMPSELGSLSDLYSLDLSNNQLTGALPSELGSLSDLYSLDLSNNLLTGAIPSELGSLSDLYSLDLSNNLLDWEIPDELNLLANLRFVRLDGNFDLTGPAHLNFTDLTTAFLGYREQETWAVAEFSSATNWSLSGTDSDDFEISSDGVLTFINPPVFESQPSIPYSVQVTASVGGTQKEATVNVAVMHRDIALSVSPGSMGEGDQATEFTVTATVDETVINDTVVTLSLSGTATGSGTDYTAGTLSTITIPADSTSTTTTLTLTPTDDEIVEGDEVVKVVGVLGDLAVTSAWIIIEDDDAATLSLSGPGAAVVEGSDATFTVTLSHAIGPAVTVEWSVTPDTGEFSPSSGSVTFPAGSAANATQSFTITAQDDDLSEGDESFTILLGAMTGDISDEVSVDPSASSVSVTIAESDPITVTLSGPSSVDEGDSATYTVSLSPDGVTPTADLTVDYATADGTAGSFDYDGVSGTLTFTSSDAGAKTVTVQTTEDSIVEDDETFSFDLSNVSGGGGPTPSLGSPSSITTTINDDDRATPPL